MSMLADLFSCPPPNEQDRKRSERAKAAAAALQQARGAYLEALLAPKAKKRRKVPPRNKPSLSKADPEADGPRELNAADLIALAAIAEDKPDDPPMGRWRFLVALAISIVTAVAVTVGLGKAPITALNIVAATDYVSIATAPAADSLEIVFRSVVHIDSLDVTYGGSAEANLFTHDGKLGVTVCPEQARRVTVQEPQGVKLTIEPGSTLTFSAPSVAGVEGARQMQISADGAWKLETTIPWRQGVVGGCNDFTGDIWQAPAKLSFKMGSPSEVLVQVPDGHGLPSSSALLPRTQLQTTSVSFETATTNGPPSRCSVLEGSIDYEQRVPFIGARFIGHTPIEKRRCPTLNLRGGGSWPVVVDAIDSGRFEVGERINTSNDIRGLYLAGPLGDQQIGESYLKILQGDAGLTTAIGFATACIANLWGFAQLLRRWLS